MARTTDNIDRLIELVRKLPASIYWDWGGDGSRIQMQAAKQKDVAAIRRALPCRVWSKSWNNATAWWEYNGKTDDGIELQIYAVSEGPRACRAITEVRRVKKKIPTSFEEIEEEESVIVGWDCGSEGD